MKKIVNTLSLLVLLLIDLMAQPSIYSPSATLVPSVFEKGQFAANLSLGFTGLSINGAYAISSKYSLGIIYNDFLYKYSPSDDLGYTSRNGSVLISRYFLIDEGGKQKGFFNIDLGLGAGGGSVNNKNLSEDYTTESYNELKAKYLMAIIQPTYGIISRNGRVSFSFTNTFVWLQPVDVDNKSYYDGKVVSSSKAWNNYLSINSTLTFKIMVMRPVGVFFQAGTYAQSLSYYNNFFYIPATFCGGLILRLGGHSR